MSKYNLSNVVYSLNDVGQTLKFAFSAQNEVINNSFEHNLKQKGDKEVG